MQRTTALRFLSWHELEKGTTRAEPMIMQEEENCQLLMIIQGPASCEKDFFQYCFVLSSALLTIMNQSSHGMLS